MTRRKKIGPFGLDKAHFGDAYEELDKLPGSSVDCAIVSPSYWNPGGKQEAEGEIGYELSPTAYIENVRCIIEDLRSALKDKGVCWLVLGDNYYDDTDLFGIPWKVVHYLQKAGWLVRSEIIWPMPHKRRIPAKSRPVRSHDHVFMLSLRKDHYCNEEALKEPVVRGVGCESFDCKSGASCHGSETTDRGSIWPFPLVSVAGAKFNALPPGLVELMIDVGCPKGGIVLAPFIGSGMIGMVAKEMGRRWIGFEIDEEMKPVIERLTK